MKDDPKKKPAPPAPGAAPAPDGATPPPADAPAAEAAPPDAALPEAIARELQELRAQAAELAGLRQKAKERDEFLDLAKRVQADFVNYQKRMTAEKEQWSKVLHADLVRDLLPALDALEACAAMAEKGGDPKHHFEGYRIAVQELARILEKNGLKAIAPTGGGFDPSVHEAVGMKETADRPENSVAELMRKGFRLHERVLRPAQVRLARKPEAPDAENGEAKDCESE